MTYLGVDLGSRAIKLAAVRHGRLVASRVAECSFEPLLQARGLLKDFPSCPVAATGYGRHLAREHFAQKVITEIKAHAIGAQHAFPECRTVLDVGGQDSKVIVLDARGRVERFQMNDKCAAGTGRFLEMMAASLGLTLEDFAEAAARSTTQLTISSMCAVFAESEVVGLRNRGYAGEDIARAVHLSVVDRLAGMLERAGSAGPLVFTGGVARNRFLVETLSRRLGLEVLVPEVPEVMGALGAALHLADSGVSSGERQGWADNQG